jgi:hypothetical protein
MRNAKCPVSRNAKCEMPPAKFRTRNFARFRRGKSFNPTTLFSDPFSVEVRTARRCERAARGGAHSGRAAGVQPVCSGRAVGAQWARSGRAVGVRPACRHVRRCDETLFWPCLILHLLPRQAQDRHKGKLRNKQGRFLSAGLFRRDHRNRWERGDRERRGNSPLARAVFSPFWK